MLLDGRYEVGARLGHGGTATVHAGIDRQLHRDVAVKLLGGDGAMAEAQIAGRVQHPCVVAVYDTGTADDGRTFIVMERLDGSLADRLRDGPISGPVARLIAFDVLSALSAAHTTGVIHRDVKPSNILLTEDGRAKLADFGVARESQSLRIDATTTSAVTGTPSYVAPERLEGRPATPQSDLWALGVVLYEAITGQKPAPGDPPLQGIDPALAAVVTRAMAREPHDRFDNASDMAAALRSDMPAATLAPTQQILTRRRSRRTPIGIAVAAAILLSVGVGWATGRQRAGQPAATTPTTSAPAGSATSTTAVIAPVAQTTPPIIKDGGVAPRKKPGKGQRKGG